MGAWASDGPYYGLKAQSGGDAIFVAPRGTLQMFNGTMQRGWWNNNGADFALTDALVERIESELCVDKSHVFSVGFSFGGMFSYALGCARADVFRAIAPMSGSFTAGCDSSNPKPIAMWGAHGVNDSVVNISGGRSARDEFLARNGCTTNTTPTDPSPCVSYQGCATGYPVTWCEWNGDHISAPFAPSAIWNFFAQF